MLSLCVSWFLGSLPWQWVTTGKVLPRQRPQSNHHPRDSRKGRSCQMERKGLFFYSSMFPLLFLSASFYICFFGWNPLLRFVLTSLYIHIISILSLSSHQSCPPLVSFSTLSFLFSTFMSTAHHLSSSSYQFSQSFSFFCSTCHFLLLVAQIRRAFIWLQNES